MNIIQVFLIGFIPNLYYRNIEELPVSGDISIDIQNYVDFRHFYMVKFM
ncbi:MAG: hypothetical protein KAS99_03470 [Candidatus Omnitrophica bacterium]|nr:hypothetical protein [Candidatus Omnitrophota bacterium]